MDNGACIGKDLPGDTADCICTYLAGTLIQPSKTLGCLLHIPEQPNSHAGLQESLPRLSSCKEALDMPLPTRHHPRPEFRLHVRVLACVFWQQHTRHVCCRSWSEARMVRRPPSKMYHHTFPQGSHHWLSHRRLAKMTTHRSAAYLMLVLYTSNNSTRRKGCEFERKRKSTGQW